MSAENVTMEQRILSTSVTTEPRIVRGKRIASVVERFWAKVDKSDNPKGCWLWRSGVNHAGYGQMNIDQWPILTHRLSYHLHFGCIPDGKHVLHHCDTPRCVNPAHFFTGNQLENGQDAASKGRCASPHSKLTVEALRAAASSGSTESQSTVATKLGVHQSTVSRAQNGKTYQHAEYLKT